jgi:hypothetical protein
MSGQVHNEPPNKAEAQNQPSGLVFNAAHAFAAALQCECGECRQGLTCTIALVGSHSGGQSPARVLSTVASFRAGWLVPTTMGHHPVPAPVAEILRPPRSGSPAPRYRRIL